MGDFKHGGGFGRQDGGRPNFPRKSWGGSGGRDRGPVTMHQATCAECGKPCEVPFRPTDGKPVYCNVCFGGKRENRYKTPVRTDFESNISKGNNDGVKKQLEILNVKMDQLIKAVTTVPAVKVKKLVKKVSKK